MLPGRWECKYEYGTVEYKKEFIARNGIPYDAELTYKHRFWGDDQYKARFYKWIADGMPGEPSEFLYGYCSLNNS